MVIGRDPICANKRVLQKNRFPGGYIIYKI